MANKIEDIIGNATDLYQGLEGMIEQMKGNLPEDDKKKFDEELKKSSFDKGKKELDAALKEFSKLKI